MKLKNSMLAVAVVLSGMLGMLMVPRAVYAAEDNSSLVAAVTCPVGSKYANQPKPTYADCNVPSGDDLPTKDVPTTAQTIINVMVSVVGIVAVAVIVIGGILYVTSTGDASKAKRAQHTILYGVVGLVVAILAYAIVNFVLKSVF